jgi:hypothetical protein
VIWPDSFLYEHKRQRHLLMSLEKNFVFFIAVVRLGGRLGASTGLRPLTWNRLRRESAMEERI